MVDGVKETPLVILLLQMYLLAPVPVSVTGVPAHMLAAGETVTPESMLAKKVIKTTSGKTPRVKILANGLLTKKLVIKGCLASATAKAAIEKAGGTFEA